MAPEDLSTTEIRFRLRGSRGRVLVRYGVNEDPARWGYPLLGLDFLVEASRGFPVVQAEVEYAAEGYAAILAWIQVLRMRDLDSGEHATILDVPPQLAGLDLPYAAFGVRPTFFDAPSTNQGGNCDWYAQATLVSSPDCLMTRRVQPLCAFGWGYRLRHGEPEPVAPQVLDEAAWSGDRDVLREHHPSWSFE